MPIRLLLCRIYNFEHVRFHELKKVTERPTHWAQLPSLVVLHFWVIIVGGGLFWEIMSSGPGAPTNNQIALPNYCWSRIPLIVINCYGNGSANAVVVVCTLALVFSRARNYGRCEFTLLINYLQWLLLPVAWCGKLDLFMAFHTWFWTRSRLNQWWGSSITRDW